MPVLLGAAVLLALWVLWQGWRMGRLKALLGLWGLWALTVSLWDRWLTYSVPEYLHHPQYALLAILLARAIDPQRRRLAVGQVLFWTTLLGMLDELLQYLWITSSYSDYLDFNDFLTNLIGAMAGVLLYYGRPGPQTLTHRSRSWLEWGVSAVLILAVAWGLLSGRVAVMPETAVPEGGFGSRADGTMAWHLQRTVPPRLGSWHIGPYRGRYWILGPVAGMGLLLGVGGLYAWAGRRGLAQVTEPEPDGEGVCDAGAQA